MRKAYLLLFFILLALISNPVLLADKDKPYNIGINIAPNNDGLLESGSFILINWNKTLTSGFQYKVENFRAISEDSDKKEVTVYDENEYDFIFSRFNGIFLNDLYLGLGMKWISRDEDITGENKGSTTSWYSEDRTHQMKNLYGEAYIPIGKLLAISAWGGYFRDDVDAEARYSDSEDFTYTTRDLGFNFHSSLIIKIKKFKIYGGYEREVGYYKKVYSDQSKERYPYIIDKTHGGINIPISGVLKTDTFYYIGLEAISQRFVPQRDISGVEAYADNRIRFLFGTEI